MYPSSASFVYTQRSNRVTDNSWQSTYSSPCIPSSISVFVTLEPISTYVRVLYPSGLQSRDITDRKLQVRWLYIPVLIASKKKPPLPPPNSAAAYKLHVLTTYTCSAAVLRMRRRLCSSSHGFLKTLLLPNNLPSVLTIIRSNILLDPTQ